jgi:hypothetical protein
LGAIQNQVTAGDDKAGIFQLQLTNVQEADTGEHGVTVTDTAGNTGHTSFSLLVVPVLNPPPTINTTFSVRTVVQGIFPNPVIGGTWTAPLNNGGPIPTIDETRTGKTVTVTPNDVNNDAGTFEWINRVESTDAGLLTFEITHGAATPVNDVTQLNVLPPILGLTLSQVAFNPDEGTGITFTASWTTTENKMLSISIVETGLGGGFDAFVNGYSGSNVFTSGNLTPTADGTYTVRLLHAEGFEKLATFTVEVNTAEPPPQEGVISFRPDATAGQGFVTSELPIGSEAQATGDYTNPNATGVDVTSLTFRVKKKLSGEILREPVTGVIDDGDETDPTSQPWTLSTTTFLLSEDGDNLEAVLNWDGNEIATAQAEISIPHNDPLRLSPDHPKHTTSVGGWKWEQPSGTPVQSLNLDADAAGGGPSPFNNPAGYGVFLAITLSDPYWLKVTGNDAAGTAGVYSPKIAAWVSSAVTGGLTVTVFQDGVEQFSEFILSAQPSGTPDETNIDLGDIHVASGHNLQIKFSTNAVIAAERPYLGYMDIGFVADPTTSTTEWEYIGGISSELIQPGFTEGTLGPVWSNQDAAGDRVGVASVIHDPTGITVGGDVFEFVMFYRDDTLSPYAENLYYTTSIDGINWTTPPTLIRAGVTWVMAEKRGTSFYIATIDRTTLVHRQDTFTDVDAINLTTYTPPASPFAGYAIADAICTSGGVNIDKYDNFHGGADYTRKWGRAGVALTGLDTSPPSTKEGQVFITGANWDKVQTYGLNAIDLTGIVTSPTYQYAALNFTFGITQQIGGQSQVGEIWPVWYGSNDGIAWTRVFDYEEAIDKPDWVLANVLVFSSTTATPIIGTHFTGLTSGITSTVEHIQTKSSLVHYHVGAMGFTNGETIEFRTSAGQTNAFGTGVLDYQSGSMLTAPSPPIQVNDEIWTYFTGLPYAHNRFYNTTQGIGLARWAVSDMQAMFGSGTSPGEITVAEWDAIVPNPAWWTQEANLRWSSDQTGGGNVLKFGLNNKYHIRFPINYMETNLEADGTINCQRANDDPNQHCMIMLAGTSPIWDSSEGIQGYLLNGKDIRICWGMNFVDQDNWDDTQWAVIAQLHPNGWPPTWDRTNIQPPLGVYFRGSGTEGNTNIQLVTRGSDESPFPTDATFTLTTPVPDSAADIKTPLAVGFHTFRLEFRFDPVVVDWVVGQDVVEDNVRIYSGSRYVCLQNHTTAVGLEPDISPTLWELGGDEYARLFVDNVQIGSDHPGPIGLNHSGLGANKPYMTFTIGNYGNSGTGTDPELYIVPPVRIEQL